MVLFTINGESGGPLFPHLISGMYVIEVIDSFGCRSDTVVEITNTTSMTTISLGEDQSILVGDTALLEAVVDLDPLEIQRVWWDQSMNCDSCLSNIVAPIHTSEFRIFVTDAFGCIASDAVTIFVDERARVFVPNIFSPNGDNINDEVRIYAHPGVSRILEFSIYDRWGNVVFYADDFFRDDTSVSWDGKFDGRKLDPAVFVYILEAELVTGRVEVMTGTITLIK
jgi:gliding motility-associated-like protein